MIFNMIGSGGSSDKSTIIVRTETNSTVGIYTDDSYSTLIKEATYKGLSSYVTISNQESSCPNYSNYWYFERYNTLSANTMEACDAATPVDARYYADSTISTSMNIADSYTARATTYVYSPIDQTLSISCTTDDDGTVYLNDTVLATLTSTKAKTVSFPLVAGINKITIIYTEGNGADGWITNPLFSVNNNITAMWGTYEPMTITIDKTQLASKLGVTSRYCNFIYNGIDWTLDGNTINLSEYGITYAATNTIGMYINFVYKYNICGEYWLQNLNNGIYYIKATKGSDTSTMSYTISEYGVYRIRMAYRTVPEFTYTGGTYEVVEDDDTEISDITTYNEPNWKIRFLTSGTLTFSNLYGATDGIDIFLVGGGGAGSNPLYGGAGGGGGYTRTISSVTVSTSSPYSVTVGEGGDRGSKGVATGANGGASSFGTLEPASGGYGGQNSVGGNGGSGGGSGTTAQTPDGETKMAGGSDGGNGSAYSSQSVGIGQGTTTREFGESSGKLYAGGGGGGSNQGSSAPSYGGAGGAGGGGHGFGVSSKPATAGEANTGGGGGAGANNTVNDTNAERRAGAGGSGIVIIRNARS